MNVRLSLLTKKYFKLLSLTTVHVLVENGTGFNFLEWDNKYEWCVMPNCCSNLSCL